MTSNYTADSEVRSSVVQALSCLFRRTRWACARVLQVYGRRQTARQNSFDYGSRIRQSRLHQVATIREGGPHSALNPFSIIRSAGIRS